MVLVLTASLAAVGAILLVFGLRGRRVGDEPRCRRCGYNLSGIESARCPECGAGLNASAVRRGVRRRRPVAVVLGATMLISGSVRPMMWAYAEVRQMNPYAWLSLKTIEQWAGDNSGRAFAELVRRVRTGDLSNADVARIAQGALAEQPKAGVQARRWTDVLHAMYRANVLDGPARRRYLEQLGRLECSIAPLAFEGMALPVYMRLTTRGPGVHRFLGGAYVESMGLDSFQREPFSMMGVVGTLAGERVLFETAYIPWVDVPPGLYTVHVTVEWSTSEDCDGLCTPGRVFEETSQQSGPVYVLASW